MYVLLSNASCRCGCTYNQRTTSMHGHIFMTSYGLSSSWPSKCVDALTHTPTRLLAQEVTSTSHKHIEFARLVALYTARESCLYRNFVENNDSRPISHNLYAAESYLVETFMHSEHRCAHAPGAAWGTSGAGPGAAWGKGSVMAGRGREYKKRQG